MMKVDIIEICKCVLTRLSKMDYEKTGGNSSEQLIFPVKNQAKGKIDRISEQELRFLFVEEFKRKYTNLFFSIETPTLEKFSFGKTYETMKVDPNGQSASHDMCIFERIGNEYNRILNIEFKHRNSDIKKSGKDILKLMHEKQDGAFIHLLENTNNGTLSSIFKKLNKSFFDHQKNWINENKSIQLVILSLHQKKIIHCDVRKKDLLNLNSILFLEKGKGNIVDFKVENWKISELD